MKYCLRCTFVTFILFLIPLLFFGQAPNLGSSGDFALFTAAGAFSNNGATVINGDVGTHVGAFTGFPPGLINGESHVANSVSAQAALDVENAYNALSGVSCVAVLGVNLGNGQTLTPNVYCTGAATTLNGILILDGECDPNAIFIIKIDGALATGVASEVVLINSASLCNVYWQVTGEVTLGENSVFRGTLLTSGAIHLLENATLFGRGLTREGAISLNNNFVDLDMQPSASIISAEGVTTLCAGGSVVLTGNCGGTWSNGETTTSITVTTSGSYFVTNSNNCGNAVSNIIIVEIAEPTVCTISGNDFFCMGGSTELCTPLGAASYLWNTGAITNCITVNQVGTFSVTITDEDGCISVCEIFVTESPSPACSITGNDFFCAGSSTELCSPLGAASYMWSTGAITNCIIVSTTGNYSVTLTDADGCISVCEILVTETEEVVCTITGNDFFCAGGSTELCTATGAASYMWSTGAITNCITINVAGNYGDSNRLGRLYQCM